MFHIMLPNNNYFKHLKFLMRIAELLALFDRNIYIKYKHYFTYLQETYKCIPVSE